MLKNKKGVSDIPALIEMQVGRIITLENGQFFPLGGKDMPSVFTYKGGMWVGFKTKEDLLSSGGKVKVKQEGFGLYGFSWLQLNTNEGPIKITNKIG